MQLTNEIFTNKIFLLFLAQFLHSYRNSDKSILKIIIENRFLTTRRVKYLWKCVATLVKIDGLSKISRWRWVAAEVFGNSWDCLTWKTRCPRSTYLILKRLILKTFLPPPHSRATLEVYTHIRTHTHTRIHPNTRTPLVSFPFFALPFYSPLCFFRRFLEFTLVFLNRFNATIFHASVLCLESNSRVDINITSYFFDPK